HQFANARFRCGIQVSPSMPSPRKPSPLTASTDCAPSRLDGTPTPRRARHVAAALTFLWKVLHWRRIGEEIGSFDRVLASTVPRTVETAIAMGFAIDDQLEVLGDLPADVWEEIGHHERWSWAEPFVMFAQFVRQGGPTSQMGRQQRE